MGGKHGARSGSSVARAIIPFLGYSNMAKLYAGIATLSWKTLVICFSQLYTHANYNAAHKPNEGALGRYGIFSESIILSLLLYSGQFCPMPVSGCSTHLR